MFPKLVDVLGLVVLYKIVTLFLAGPGLIVGGALELGGLGARI